MNPIRHFLLGLALAAGALSLAPADARPRGAKQAVNPAPHLGQPHRANATIGGRRTTQPVTVVPGKNAIGIATPPAIPPPSALGTSAGTNATGAVKANAIGAHVGATAVIPPAPAGAVKLIPGGVPAPAVHRAVPAYGGTISGTGLARPGSAPGVIGGPAKIAAGLNGTGMKSRAH